jgi:plasmid stability protein
MATIQLRKVPAEIKKALFVEAAKQGKWPATLAIEIITAWLKAALERK